jgi:hypothetical protein
VHIRIGLYGKNQKQFKIGELLNSGGYSVEFVTGKEQQIIMGELFKWNTATQLGLTLTTFEDEDFDVSIIVVATEGEDRYSNTQKDLPCKRKYS